MANTENKDSTRGNEKGAAFILKITHMANQNRNEQRGLASADQETREQVARKGGEAVSQDREHMAEIGRRGGESSGRNRREQNR